LNVIIRRGKVLEKTFRGLVTANLRAFRFASEPTRLWGYLRDLEYAYQSCTYSPLKPVELAELIGNEASQSLFLPVGYVCSGSTPLGDLAALAALVQKKRPKRIFEIGTFEGLTSVLFVRNSGVGALVHTLDLPPACPEVPRTQRSYSAHSIADPYVSGHLIDAFEVRQQVQAMWGDSALFDFAPFHDQIDLFFVDGAHTEDYVALDSYHAFQCLASDGWVVWHDCFAPQVLKVLKRIAQRSAVLHIRGTNLALVMGRLTVDLFDHLKRNDIH
jgi:predicted O-methyltransferase YrrM